MTKRYILIDSNSGFVWGEARTADIVAAARSVDLESAGRAADSYEDIGHDPRDTSGYYIVHDGSGSDIAVDDGQNRDQIAAVETLPVAGYVRRIFDL